MVQIRPIYNLQRAINDTVQDGPGNDALERARFLRHENTGFRPTSLKKQIMYMLLSTRRDYKEYCHGEEELDRAIC